MTRISVISPENPLPTSSQAVQTKQSLRVRLYVMLIGFDCLCVLASFTAASFVRNPKWLSLDGINLAAMFLPIYLAIAIGNHVYSHKRLLHPEKAAVQVAISCFYTMLMIQSVLYFAHVSDNISRLAFVIGMTLSTAGMVLIRWPFSRYANRRSSGSLMEELLILDGMHVPASDHVDVLDAEAAKITPDINDPFMLNHLGSILRRYDRAVIACQPERYDAWALVLKGANIRGEIIVPHSRIRTAIGISHFDQQDTQIVSRGPLNMTNRAKKRLIDVSIATLAVIAVSPLLVLVAALIKLDSPGPVFFLQERVGRGNRLFKIIKFRSMYTHLADQNGSTSTSRGGDPRITRVGAFIRKYSIDELPQLFNVLLGDMSLVGPRPHALGSTADHKLFWEVSELYWCRHALKPGITGLAQIRGFRGTTEKEADLQNRLQADLEYLNDWSVSREFYILLATAKVVIHRNAF